MRHLSLLNYTFTIILLYRFLKNSTRFRDKPLWGVRGLKAQRVVLSGIPEGACACGAEGHMASIGPPALGAKGCVERLHPTGKTTHYILCAAPLLHPLLSLTHWIFRSLMLPYKSSSLVQNVFAVHRFAQGATAAMPLRVEEAPYGRNIKSALRDLLLCHQCCPRHFERWYEPV